MPGPGSDIELIVNDRVATITISRERKRNALAQRHFVELVNLLDAADAIDDANVIVLTGAGDSAFCAGADLTPDEQFFERVSEETRTGLGNFLRRARRLSKPLLGRINGDCYAGGVGLLAACDLAIATEESRFALPEVKLGLFPFVVAVGLRRKISSHAVSELALTGMPISARRAEQIGLVTRCVTRGDLDHAVASLASILASQPRNAIKFGRPSLGATDGETFETELAGAEASTRALAASRSK